MADWGFFFFFYKSLQIVGTWKANRGSRCFNDIEILRVNNNFGF